MAFFNAAVHTIMTSTSMSLTMRNLTSLKSSLTLTIDADYFI